MVFLSISTISAMQKDMQEKDLVLQKIKTQCPNTKLRDDEIMRIITRWSKRKDRDIKEIKEDDIDALVDDVKNQEKLLSFEATTETKTPVKKAKPAPIKNITITEDPNNEYETVRKGSVEYLVKKNIPQKPKNNTKQADNKKSILKSHPKKKVKTNQPKAPEQDDPQAPLPNNNQGSVFQQIANFMQTPKGILMISLTANILFSLYFLCTR